LLAETTLTKEMVQEVLKLRVTGLDGGFRPAWSLARRESVVDLLLTDMVCARRMIGTDVAAELRRVNPGLKVIFTTGYSQVLWGPHSLERVNFLPKPYSPTQLAGIVRQCLDKVPSLCPRYCNNLLRSIQRRSAGKALPHPETSLLSWPRKGPDANERA
jgi:DNA-binding LytR/AlgR family response regulator